MIKIAILTPNDALNAETFIKNHINHLPFEKVIIYGGNFPYISDATNPDFFKKAIFIFENKLRVFFGLKSKSYKAYCLKHILEKEKVDLVFCEYLVTGAETLETIKGLNLPLIATALGYDISQYKVLEIFKDKYISLFKYATNIVVVSNHMRTNLKVFNCPEEKITYSPASPNKDFFNLKPIFNNQQLLAVGRFVEKKAPLLLIKVFALVSEEIPEAVLVMAGDGPLLLASKKLVHDYKLKDKVIFKGRISSQEHQELLKESCVFVQHSRLATDGDSEGTPVAILEASAAGLPVVSTIHAGIPDVVLHDKTGLLSNEGDIEAMSNNIVSLLKSPQKAAMLGENGKTFVSKNFSLAKHISKLSQLIESSVDKNDR